VAGTFEETVPAALAKVTPERATTYREDKKLAKFAKQLLSAHRALRGLRGLSDQAVGRLL